MNKITSYYSFIASLTGFLFGFDTVVISGANLPLKNLWETADWFHGFFIMSVALWGTVIGALFGGIPCNKLGRKSTLFWIGVFFLISAIGTALATDPYVFSFYRFIGGLAIGASSIAAPTYVSEISLATSTTASFKSILYSAYWQLIFPTIIYKEWAVSTIGDGCWQQR